MFSFDFGTASSWAIAPVVLLSPIITAGLCLCSGGRRMVQIWAHTTEGRENDAHSHGATLTGADGTFRLEMPQIIPAFGQAHGHLAYEGDGFRTVFLRPVMACARDTSLSAHFVLQPV